MLRQLLAGLDDAQLGRVVDPAKLLATLTDAQLDKHIEVVEATMQQLVGENPDAAGLKAAMGEHEVLQAEEYRRRTLREAKEALLGQETAAMARVRAALGAAFREDGPPLACFFDRPPDRALWNRKRARAPGGGQAGAGKRWRQNGTHGIANALDPVRPQMKKLLALNRMTAEEREAKGKQFILQKTKKYLITIGDHIAKAIEEGSIKPCEEKDAWRTVREVSKNSLTADKLAEIYRKLKVRQAVQGRQEDKRLADAGE